VEFKTLFLGMFISMAAFSVKAGMGWAYLLSGRSPGRKAAASLAVLVFYAAIFAVVTLFVSRVNLLANYEIFRPLWEGGVTLHWLTAVFILIWGLVLLRSKPAGSRSCDNCGDGGKSSRAWIALLVPCPVCMSVVLTSASCLAMYFPDDAPLAMTGLYAAFVALAAASGVAVSLGKTAKTDEEGPEKSLGTAMIMIAAYFIVSALVMPQFADISKIYRLAVYSRESAASGPAAAWGTAGAIFLLFAAGFAMAHRRIARPPKPPERQKIYDYGSEPR